MFKLTLSMVTYCYEVPKRNYGHEQTWHDGNGHSHLRATILGPSLTVRISDGKLVLGRCKAAEERRGCQLPTCCPGSSLVRVYFSDSSDLPFFQTISRSIVLSSMIL
jgi:hypothetical protein